MKFFVFCFMLLLGTAKLIAQQTIIGKGKMVTFGGANTTEEIDFLREENINDFTTKYTVLLSGSEIYEIGFKFINHPDSILIYWFDKRQVLAGQKSLKLRKDDSCIIIKNYKLYDTTVKLISREYYIILLSVVNQKEPYVDLHEFKTMDSQPIYFMFSKLKNETLIRHDLASEEYWRKYYDSIRRAKKDSAFKQKMVFSKDSLITAIKNEMKSNREKPANLSADANLQQVFKKRLDSVFLRNFKNLTVFKDSEFDVAYKFPVDGNNKIVKSAIEYYPVRRMDSAWCRDTFDLKILPEIENKYFSTLTETVEKPTVQSNFEYRFTQLSDNDPDYNGYRENQKDTLKLISADLKDYVKKQSVNVPTNYTYSFKYKTVVTLNTWKYKTDDAVPTLKKGETASEALVKKFIETVWMPGTSRYDVNILSIYINGQLVGENIQKALKK